MDVFARPSEGPTKELLASCALPVADLQSAHFQHFFACGSQTSPTGVIGVELHGQVALLRSLAVAKSARSRGYGRRLVSAAEAHARTHGVRSVYLLTSTAEAYFKALGYFATDRESVPEAIRVTPEFATLCPASAIVLVKRLEA